MMYISILLVVYNDLLQNGTLEIITLSTSHRRVGGDGYGVAASHRPKVGGQACDVGLRQEGGAATVGVDHRALAVSLEELDGVGAGGQRWQGARDLCRGAIATLREGCLEFSVHSQHMDVQRLQSDGAAAALPLYALGRPGL